MKTKTLPFSGIKAGPDDGLEEGEFIVYPATFTRTPDAYGDVIAKGAFAQTIKDWKASGDQMPGMYLHDPNQIVAGATDMGEDDHGWWVRGKFDDDPDAQKVYRQLKGRRLSRLSFAYDVEDSGEVKVDNDVKANELRKINAFEFSFLPKGFAANEDTSVVAVKHFAEQVFDLPGAKKIPERHMAKIRAAAASAADAGRLLREVVDSETDGKSTDADGNGADPEYKTSAPEGADDSHDEASATGPSARPDDASPGRQASSKASVGVVAAKKARLRALRARERS